MMKTQFEKDLAIWYGIFIRALIVGGLFLFGNAVTTGFNLMGALIVAGLYLFMELARKYGLSDLISKQNLNNYRYVILP